MFLAAALAAGFFAFDGVACWIGSAAVPLEPTLEPESFPSFLVPFLVLTVVIQAVLVGAYAWTGYHLCKAGGEFVCRLDTESLDQFDPAGAWSFRLALADIVCVERRSDHDGSPTWYVWSQAGRSHQLSAYDNPAEALCDRIVQLRPDVPVVRTTDDRPWTPGSAA